MISERSEIEQWGQVSEDRDRPVPAQLVVAYWEEERHPQRGGTARKSALYSILCHPGGGKLHAMGRLVVKEST